MRTLKEAPLTPGAKGKLEPSPEVKGLMAQFYEAASHGNFEALDGMVSHRAGLAWIGTDPEEWWDTAETVSRAWREQTRALGKPARITAGKISAYQHGDVAWVSDRPAFHLPGGRTLPFRLTAVWLREPEGWRIAQFHTSLGVANQDVLPPA